jgi:transposase
VIPGKSRNEYEKLCDETVKKWESCHKNGMKTKEIQEILGVSRATYYRRKKALVDGVIKSKKPKRYRKSKFEEDIRQLILKIRKENLTYGKFKTCIVLKKGVQYK